MPAAVAVPLITTAIGAGASAYSAKKQADAQKAANAAGARNPSANAVYANQGAESTGGGGGGSSSGGSHSWSKGGTVIDPEVRNAAFGANSRFLEDGGLSQTDLASMRARALSPVRASYANAEREIGRQRSLQGGYSPNATAALARMGREQGQAVSDAATNAEAGIIGLRQQGQLAGLQGMNSMYANMPTYQESESNSWNNSSSGGGGGGSGAGGAEQAPVQGGPGWLDWLRKAGEVALPTIMSSVGGNRGGGGVPNIPVQSGPPRNLPGTPVGVSMPGIPPPYIPTQSGPPSQLPGMPVNAVRW